MNTSQHPALCRSIELVDDTNDSARDSLCAWISEYWRAEVQGSSRNTVDAKFRDLKQFIGFFQNRLRSDHVDDWTKSVTREFCSWLVSEANNTKAYDASSANRKIRTLRHCARWIQRHREFPGGNPFNDVYEFDTDEPDWKGVSRIERLRLLAASERLLTLKSRRNQQPLRDHAVFLVLLHTGLRVSELVNLNLDQYSGKDLKNVRRKGRKETKRLPVPSDARAALDDYVGAERGPNPGPLFCSRTGNRITRQQIDRVLKNIAGQANSKLPKGEHIQLHAHKLRHTALKTLTDRNGGDLRKVLKVSGHSGLKHLVRYVQATYDEVAESMENMYR